MYLDANVFAFAGFDETSIGQRARKFLKDVHMGKTAMTSSLTFDEFMWTAIKQKRQGELRNLLNGFYSLHNLDIKPVSSLIPLRAMAIMEETGLKPRDSFHVAIMEEFGVKEIVSDDSDFDKVPWIERIKI